MNIAYQQILLDKMIENMKNDATETVKRINDLLDFPVKQTIVVPVNVARAMVEEAAYRTRLVGAMVSMLKIGVETDSPADVVFCEMRKLLEAPLLVQTFEKILPEEE